MAVTGNIAEKKEAINIELWKGFTTIEEIICINPTPEKKAELLGYEYDEDGEEKSYIGENAEGDVKLDLNIYLKPSAHEKPVVYRIYLENRDIEFKDATTGQIKYKYINQLGQTAISPDEESLQEWFTHFQTWDNDERKFISTKYKKTYRKALAGEDKLTHFVRESLNRLSQSDVDASLFVDMKKLFKGNTKELLSDLNSEYFSPFMGLLNVTTSKDGSKNYQDVYFGDNTFNLPSIPVDFMKFINNGGNFTGSYAKRWKKYKEDVMGKYGAKGFFKLEAASKYDSSEDIATATVTKKETAETDSDY